ncbi:MAG: NADP-dependent oxidoreductase domain protein [Gemmatimonadetes bacterium]|nr:NADP-dependent oxidoreductase domain protein [Gemmatimonadota bacterium]
MLIGRPEQSEKLLLPVLETMQYRELGRTGWKISTVSFGAWGIGGDVWGNTDDEESMRALHRAVDLGTNFIDTADVYGDGHSERLIARLRKERSEEIIVATKAGRRLDQQLSSGYNRANLTAFVERSLVNLDTDALDLLQLHCPPSDVYMMPEVFAILDDLVAAGKLKFYGVSVEKVDEALQAITYAGVQSVQIIFNMFRLKPSEAFFAAAHDRKVGILARVPLASGLLSGRMRANTTFAESDHRVFNRFGAAFDQGETFSGVDYDTALEAVEELRPLVPAHITMAQFALEWILSYPAVTAAIPGAKNVQQVNDNVRASDLPLLSDGQLDAVRDIYDRYIRASIHDRW